MCECPNNIKRPRSSQSDLSGLTDVVDRGDRAGPVAASISVTAFSHPPLNTRLCPHYQLCMNTRSALHSFLVRPSQNVNSVFCFISRLTWAGEHNSVTAMHISTPLKEVHVLEGEKKTLYFKLAYVILINDN